MKFRHVGLITKIGIKTAQKTLNLLIDYLKTKDCEPILDTCCAELLANPPYRSYKREELGKHCDLIIAVGGDGTMLMASRVLFRFDIPLVGINLGHTGFLADIQTDHIQTCMDDILIGNYIEDHRVLLEASIWQEKKLSHKYDAFNDVVIQKWNIGRLIELSTYIDDTFVHRQRSDGLIVSTPTGSTAYALASGGPIVHPSLDALLLVPICPHSLNNRPIILHGQSMIEVIVGPSKTDHARLICDGETVLKLAPGDRIRIKKQDKTICLIHPPDNDYFKILREKLHWNK